MNALIQRRPAVERRLSLFTRADIERLYAVVGRSGVLYKARQNGGVQESNGLSDLHGKRGGTNTAPLITFLEEE